MIGLLAAFGVGFTVWLLALARLAAWDTRRTVWLIGLVMTDEFLGIVVGMYLARHGTWDEAAAIAVGGGVAAWIMSRRVR